MSDDLFDLLMEGSHFEETRETIIKAPFAWAGSKARSLQHVLPHLPYRRVFVDVFGGSGSVTLGRRPSKLDVYNDAFSGVTDFYRCVKDDVLLAELIAWLKINIHSRELFNIYKSEWKNTADIVERAGKWYYMVVMSFGSLGRNFGRSTSSNVSLAKKLQNNLDLFWPVHHRFKDVQVENSDFEQCIKDYDSHDTVFYLDPPYMYSDVGIYEEAWNLEKHKRLLQVVFSTEGFCALSGYENELYDSMPWDHKITWETHITIAAKAHTETNHLKDKVGMLSKNAIECLWIKEVK